MSSDTPDIREELPELGSTEAAVRSVVNLVAMATGKREEQVAYWLDLYYQVRAFHEARQAVAVTMAAAFERESHESIMPTDPAADSEPLREKNKPKNENRGLPSGEYKRQVLDRLETLRANGLTFAKIIKASDNTLNESTLIAILNRASVPVAIYRILDKALDVCAESA